MISERGTVVRVSVGEATVRIPRDSQCTKCPGCAVAENGLSMLAQVVDPIGVHPGDEVEISNSHMRPALDGAILLILPIILFVIGYLVGNEYLPPVATVPLALVVASFPVLYIRWKETHGVYKLHVDRVTGRGPTAVPLADSFTPADAVKSSETDAPEAIRIRDVAAAQARGGDPAHPQTGAKKTEIPD